MAHFYGTIESNGGHITSKTGSKNSGLRTICNGWNDGVEVIACSFKKDDGTDYDSFSIYSTGGSNKARNHKEIAKIWEGELYISTPSGWFSPDQFTELFRENNRLRLEIDEYSKAAKLLAKITRG